MSSKNNKKLDDSAMKTNILSSTILYSLFFCISQVDAFTQNYFSFFRYNKGLKLQDDSNNDLKSDETESKKENKAMAFLRKVGRVGGAANKDFVNALGVDEGPVGKSSLGKVGSPTDGNSLGNVKKAKSAYKQCNISGVVDDFTEPFPFTSSGTQWSGFTDHVMGGMSSGSLTREEVKGKVCNVLRGHGEYST